MINPLDRKKRKHGNKKYRPKYTKQLLNGVRRNGVSKDELCQMWGISPSTYLNWTRTIPEFSEADEIGERDYRVWWSQLYRNVASGQQEGNAGLLKFAATNVLGWADKSETNSHHEEEIRIIEIIEMSPPQTRIIEHQKVDQIEYASESASNINPKSEEIR